MNVCSDQMHLIIRQLICQYSDDVLNNGSLSALYQASGRVFSFTAQCLEMKSKDLSFVGRCSTSEGLSFVPTIIVTDTKETLQSVIRTQQGHGAMGWDGLNC